MTRLMLLLATLSCSLPMYSADVWTPASSEPWAVATGQVLSTIEQVLSTTRTSRTPADPTDSFHRLVKACLITHAERRATEHALQFLKQRLNDSLPHLNKWLNWCVYRSDPSEDLETTCTSMMKHSMHEFTMYGGYLNVLIAEHELTLEALAECVNISKQALSEPAALFQISGEGAYGACSFTDRPVRMTAVPVIGDAHPHESAWMMSEDMQRTPRAQQHILMLQSEANDFMGLNTTCFEKHPSGWSQTGKCIFKQPVLMDITFMDSALLNGMIATIDGKPDWVIVRAGLLEFYRVFSACLIGVIVILLMVVKRQRKPTLKVD